MICALRAAICSPSATVSSFARRTFGNISSLFFLHVMIDVFAQDLHFGVIVIVGGRRRFDLRDQVFRACMLNVGFVNQIRLAIDSRAAG